MSGGFAGFPAQSFRFLRGLRDNNTRPWFEDHKADYQEYVLAPFRLLVAELGPAMRGIDRRLEVTPAVGKTISRIYRDTRFSRNKLPYKTNHWITFKRTRKDWKNSPAFFLELSPESYRYGMGFYAADRATMDRFRGALDMDPAPFLAAIASYAPGDFTLEGESYKRPLRADVEESLRDWYNRKSFFLVRNRTVRRSTIDATLATELRTAFTSLSSLYHFLVEATEQGGFPSASEAE